MKNTPLFTKGQRIAIITLIVMIVCFVGAKVYIQQKTSKLPNYTQEAQDFQKEIERFEASLKQKAKKTYTHKNTEKKKQKAEGRKDGENEWRSTTWKRKWSAEVRDALRLPLPLI